MAGKYSSKSSMRSFQDSSMACNVKRDPNEGLNWQEKMTHPIDSLKHLFETRKMSDVTLKLKDAEGNTRTFVAHKVILAMMSYFFQLLFQNSQESVFVIEGIDAEVFEKIIRFFYLGELEFEADLKVEVDVDCTMKIARAAKKLKMGRVMQLCVRRLIQIFYYTTDESIRRTILKANNELKDESLGTFLAAQYSLTDYDDFNRTRLFPESLLKLFLDLFVGKEGSERCVFLFSVVHDWAKHRSGAVHSKTKELVKQFLPRLNFLSLSKTDFLEKVVPTGMLGFDEIASITNNLEKKENEVVIGQLPDWCSLCCKDDSEFDWIPLLQDKTSELVSLRSDSTWSLNFSSEGPAFVIWYFVLISDLSLDLEGNIKVNGRETCDVTAVKWRGNSYYRVYPNKIVRLEKGKNELEVNLTLSRGYRVPRNATVETIKYKDTYKRFCGQMVIKIKPTNDLPIRYIGWIIEKKLYLRKNKKRT